MLVSHFPWDRETFMESLMCQFTSRTERSTVSSSAFHCSFWVPWSVPHDPRIVLNLGLYSSGSRGSVLLWAINCVFVGSPRFNMALLYLPGQERTTTSRTALSYMQFPCSIQPRLRTQKWPLGKWNIANGIYQTTQYFITCHKSRKKHKHVIYHRWIIHQRSTPNDIFPLLRVPISTFLPSSSHLSFKRCSSNAPTSGKTFPYAYWTNGSLFWIPVGQCTSLTTPAPTVPWNDLFRSVSSTKPNCGQTPCLLVSGVPGPTSICSG